MKIIKNLIFKAFLIGMPFLVQAQNATIQGVIVDANSKTVVGATIIISAEKDSDDVLSFASSDSFGKFVIEKTKSQADSIWITVRHLEYNNYKRKIANRNSSLKIELLRKTEQLAEVLIAPRKIVTIKGDTLTYDVEGLKAKKDYTIEEVIARIPGVSISENGQIKYFDKAISHLYINGLDLLEGRYNIATRGIPASAVKDIAVYKNHNHERINIGRRDSEEVSINLKIKNGQNVVFGSAKNEAAVPLLTGLADVTPIYIKAKFQSIASFKANNIGASLKSNGESLSIGDINMYKLKVEDTPIIRPTNTNGSVLSNKYWLDNESLSVTNDALLKVSDSTLVKFNINFLNEVTAIQSQSLRTFLSGVNVNDVTTVSNNELRTKRFQIGLNQEINKKNIYLKNNTNLYAANDNGIENIVLNQNQLTAGFQNSNVNISNATVVKRAFGKDKILSGGALFQYNNQSEVLHVTPAVFTQNAAVNGVSESTRQVLDISKFNAGMFSDYSFLWLKMNWTAAQNIQYNNFQFRSQLNQNPQINTIQFPFVGDFQFQKLKSITRLQTKRSIGNLNLKVSISADFLNIFTREREINDAKNESYFFLQPVFSLTYKIKNNWDSGFSISQNRAVSDFQQIFQPVVMTSFNMLSQNPPVINVVATTSFAPFISYSNILNNFYATLRGSIGKTSSDVTFASELNNQGFLTMTVLERANVVNNNSISLNVNKSVLGILKTDFSYMLSSFNNELFFNNQFINAQNQSHTIDASITVDNGTWYSFAYKANYRNGKTTFGESSIDNIFLFHGATVDLYAGPKSQWQFGAESARASATMTAKTDVNTMFNANYTYKSSSKLIFKAALLNILNTSVFQTTYGGTNAVSISQFALRPRQFTIGLTYSF